MIDSFDTGQATVAEKLEKCVVIEVADAGYFEFQQRILPRIHIDSIDMIETRQGVGEGVASRRGDNQKVVLWGQIEHLFVYSRVFPARVIDEIISVNESKDPTAEPFINFFHF